MIPMISNWLFVILSKSTKFRKLFQYSQILEIKNQRTERMTILYVHLEGEKGLKDWTEKIEYSEQQSKDVTILELKLVKKKNYNNK